MMIEMKLMKIYPFWNPTVLLHSQLSGMHLQLRSDAEGELSIVWGVARNIGVLGLQVFGIIRLTRPWSLVRIFPTSF